MNDETSSRRILFSPPLPDENRQNLTCSLQLEDRWCRNVRAVRRDMLYLGD